MYIDINFLQVENDWNSNPGMNTKKVTKYPAK